MYLFFGIDHILTTSRQSLMFNCDEQRTLGSFIDGSIRYSFV